MNPGNINTRSDVRYQPLPTNDWREELRDLKVNSLIRKFVNNTAAIPNEDELNGLVCECMLQGATKALFAMLTQESLRTLRVTGPISAQGWQTLLEALPDPSDISELVVTEQKFDMRSSDLFRSCMRRMPDLRSLCLTSCTMHAGLLGWPDLKSLQNLHLEKIDQPYELMMHVLKTSSLTTLYLSPSSQRDLDVGLHDKLAQALVNQSVLRGLTLANLQAGVNLSPVLHSYATKFLATQNTLEHLDLSGNRLSSDDFSKLWEVLQHKTALSSLSLAGCCPQVPYKFDWKHVEKLVSLPSLVSLDLSCNCASEDLLPVLLAIASHPKLLHLKLDSADATLVFLDHVLPVFLANARTLISLQLPDWPDGCFKCLPGAMEANHVLRSLSIPAIEQKCSKMPTEAPRMYPNYIALMSRIALNQKTWEEKMFPRLQGAMEALLGVPNDIAAHAARIAWERNGDNDLGLTLLNKSAYQKGVTALALAKEKKE